MSRSISKDRPPPSARPGRRPAEARAEGYEHDFYAWTQRQAALLRSRDLHLADLDHIAEEIETLGRSERAALESAYRLIALYLLKLQYQPTHAGRSWHLTIMRERLNAARLLRANPALKTHRDDLFASAYRDARKEATAETGLPAATFPVIPPFDLIALEDETFLPEA